MDSHVGNWFDDERLKQQQLNEARLPFGEDERSLLRSRPIAFVFVAGWKMGLQRIREATKTLNLDATVFAHLTDEAIPFAFEGALVDQDQENVTLFEKKVSRHWKGVARVKWQEQGETGGACTWLWEQGHAVNLEI